MSTKKHIYIENKVTGELFYFDAVFDVTYTQQGELTQYRVESGARVSDHYDNLPDSIYLRGSVSRFKMGGYESEVTDMDVMLQRLQHMKRNKHIFTIAFSDDLNPLPNCLFESLESVQNKETGRHSVDLEIHIRQVRFGARAGLVLMPEPLEAYIDDLNEGGKKPSNLTEVDESEECIKVKKRVGDGKHFEVMSYFQHAQELGCNFLQLYDSNGRYIGD